MLGPVRLIPLRRFEPDVEAQDGGAANEIGATAPAMRPAPDGRRSLSKLGFKTSLLHPFGRAEVVEVECIISGS